MSDPYQKSVTANTLPKKGYTIKAPVKPHLPCLVILVHGVNDVGEAYSAQEQGLCWGLAERLSRNYDLKPYAYKLPSEHRDDPLEVNPDNIYYQRTKASDSFSPIVPFYWGFREEERLIKKHEWHGQWLDRHGNRIDKNGAKGGGAFVNATDCLPHMWAEGWGPSLLVWGINAAKPDPTHDLRRAPYRSYQVLAALRLAMLIRIIRKRHPKVAINVVAHSQGGCVAMLAQAYLVEDGHPPADTLVLNHSTYSFTESFLDDEQFGGANQTTRARIDTFKNIVKATRDRAAKGPSLEELKEGSKATGFAGDSWGPGRATKVDCQGNTWEFQERDNRGHTYLYFSPEDKTVALMNTQGLGWQGVPDQYSYDGSDPMCFETWDTLMDDLQALGFRQRIFFKQLRGGQRFKVGLPCQHVSIRELRDTNGSLWANVKRLCKARKTPDIGAMRRINGPELQPPIDFVPGPEVLPISPIDAAIALAHGGEKGLVLSKDVADPRPRERRPPDARSGDDAYLRAFLNQGKPLEDQMEKITEVLPQGDGRLLVQYLPTADGIRKHWQSIMTEECSHHSSIVSNHWHSQMVTAYDLALGEPIEWNGEEEKFYEYLCEVADWRIKTNNQPEVDDKVSLLGSFKFFDIEDQKHKALITDTATYYCEGVIPPQIREAKSASQLSLICFEATGWRKIARSLNR